MSVNKVKSKAINKERVQELVNALRSGEYTQCQTVLQDDNGNNCCLGVACRVAGMETTINQESGLLVFDGQAATLPRSAREYYGFDSDNPALKLPDHIKSKDAYLKQYVSRLATALNDSYNLSFDEIADCFEYTYLQD